MTRGYKLKKITFLLLGLVLTATLLAGACTKPAATTTGPTSTQPPTTTAQVIKWVGQCPGTTASAIYIDFKKMSDRINKASNGRMQLTAQPTGAVVPGMKEWDGINDGVLQYAASPPAYWMDKFPAAGLFSSTVGGLSALESVFWYMNEGRALAKEMIGTKYKINIDFVNRVSTAEVFLWSTKPLKTVADIKGLKIRTSGDDGACFTAMGAAVVNIPGNEVYEAASRGTIDAAQVASPKNDYDTALHEVLKYCYLSPVRQALEFNPLEINTDAWAKLTPDLQEIVEAESYYAILESYAAGVRDDVQAIAEMKSKGVVVETISDEIANELKRQADIYYAGKSAKDAFFGKVYKSKMDFLKSTRDAWPRL
jgi:TRAP-type mannitol/chloroaromatic compound transport system substrate-binding protein